ELVVEAFLDSFGQLRIAPDGADRLADLPLRPEIRPAGCRIPLMADFLFDENRQRDSGRPARAKFEERSRLDAARHHFAGVRADHIGSITVRRAHAGVTLTIDTLVTRQCPPGSCGSGSRP